jgi:hypothetical protein
VIDGIQLTHYVNDPNSNLLGLSCWEVLVNEKTGERVNEFKTTHIRGLDLRLKPSLKKGYTLLINGSLHKFHNCGEHNTDQFTFWKLIQSIDSLQNILEINPKDLFIHGLEIGVNINLPYSPLRVLKNVVCYRSRPLTQINTRDARKGLKCSLSQYSLKIYDKERQSGKECGNVLRFEISIDKMQMIQGYGIKTLADLQDATKVYPLISVLKSAFNGIVWTDTTANLKRLTQKELKQWLFFSNSKNWENLNKHQRTRALLKWDLLLKKYSKSDSIFPLLLDTWNTLFSDVMEALNPQPFYQHQQELEAEKTTTFLPFICTVKKSHSELIKTPPSSSSFPIKQNNNKQNQMTVKKSCITCGKNISDQKKNSIFCSEKVYGKIAKKCRNKRSNERREHKKKIEAALKSESFLIVSYQAETGDVYSDILKPDEIDLSSFAFKILTIKILK